MISNFDVYATFRREQGNFHNRGYKLPKNWDSHWEKMRKSDKDAIELACIYFNTKWKDLDMERYFQSGFFVFKHLFTYTKFFDKRILKDYIVKDRNKKRDLDNVKRDFTTSLKWVIKFLDGKKIDDYVQMKQGEMSLPVSHYIQGKIDGSLLCYLIMKRILKLSDLELSRCPYIEAKYREYIVKLGELGIYD